MALKSIHRRLCGDFGHNTYMMKALTLFLLLIVATAVVHGEAWRKQVAQMSSRAKWIEECNRRYNVTPDVLDQSLEAARVYYINAQLPEGNFRYGLDLTDNLEDSDDNQVRQAGALWGLSKLCRERFTEESRRAVLLGLDFFIRHRRRLPGGGPEVITYRAERTLKTGTVALFCLAMIEFLEGQERYLTPERQEPFLNVLYSNLQHLQNQELPDGSWRAAFDMNYMPDEQENKSSPYYDGESLLCYLTAEKYFAKRPHLRKPAGLSQRIDYAMPLLIKKYVADALHLDGDPDLTKGFFQWGLMSFAEFCESRKGADADLAVQAAMTLSWWQIYDNRIDARGGNTGYAIEGLVGSWRIAKARHLDAEAEVLRDTIDRVLGRLITWQVGGPLEKHNPFLMHWKNRTPARAFGGITATAISGYIRIDIVQHQVHAMLLARKYLYPN